MAIYKRGGVWWVDVYVGHPPKRIRKSTKTTVESQARIIEQTMVGVNHGVTPRQQAVAILDALLPQAKAGVKIADLAAFYKSCVEEEGQRLGERTLQQRLANLLKFVAWAEQNARAVTVDEIGADEAFAYSKVLVERGMIGKTVNSYLGDLSTVWKMLVKRSKATVNPWPLVRVRRDRSKEHTGRAFTHEEFERILAVAKEVGFDWEGMVIVGAYTGLRMPDVAGLRWDGDPEECLVVDLVGRRIYGTPSKTAGHGIRVNVPMHERVYLFLAEAARNRADGEAFVFPWRATHSTHNKMYGEDVPFSKILEKAGVVATSSRDKLSFHCLRHTFVSWLSEAGVAEDVRMRMTGHTNKDTHAIYTHDDKSARAAISRLA